MKINFTAKTNHSEFIKEYLTSLGYELEMDGAKFSAHEIRGSYVIYKHPEEKVVQYNRVCLSDLDVYTSSQGTIPTNSDLDTIKELLSKENLNIPL